MNQKEVKRPMAICVSWVIKKMCFVLCIFPMPTFPRLSFSLWALENFLTPFWLLLLEAILFSGAGEDICLGSFHCCCPESQSPFSLHNFQPLPQFQPPLLMELPLPGEPLLAGVEQTAQQHWFWTIRNGTFLFFGFVPVPHWLLFRGRGSSVIMKAQLLCCVFSFLCPLSWPCEQQKGLLHQLVFSNKVFVTSGLVVGWALEAIFTPQVMAFQTKWCYITLLKKTKH